MVAKSASPDALQILSQIGITDLPRDWKTHRVEDLLSDDRGISVGVMYPGDDDPRGIPLVRASDLAGSRINRRPEFRITPDKHHEYRRTELAGGELLISLVGDVGRCAIVPPEMAGWNAARAIAVLRFKNPADGAFVRACLMSAPLQHLMQAWSTTTVQPTLNLKEIRQISLPWPPTKQRDTIAHILGTLDDKIELNRRMNETLEALARTLFKSWFVDFDPVRAKMDGRWRPRESLPGLPAHLYDLFPDRLVDSELGEIPEGWQTAKVGDLCSAIFSGGTPSTKVQAYWDGQIPWLSSGETRNSFIVNTERHITSAGVSSSSTRLAPAMSTVIASAGQGNTRGQTSLVGFDTYINQSVVALCANRATSSPFHLYFDLERRYEEFRRISDAHSSRGSLTTKLIAGTSATVPPRDVVGCFDELVGPLVGRLFALKRESRSLAAQRDALLPKLISGELRMNSGATVFEEAAS